MRIFVPATMADLATLQRDGFLPAENGYALTGHYRAAVGAEIADDDEVLDYDLLMAAAAASLDRQAAEHSRRRVVVAVDAPARPDPADPASGRVLVEGPIRRRDVASVHVDDTELGPAAETVADADSTVDLSWYAPQEIADLLQR